MPSISQVFFFDIDGTLISTGGAGRSAMERAFLEVHGIAGALREVPMAGRVDPAIYAGAVARFGLEPDEAAFRTLYYDFLREELPRFRRLGQLMPGVSPLLGHLTGLPEVRVGLLTGNWRRGAFLKLEYYGIAQFFDFELGAFGDDAADRNALPAVAIARAGERVAGGLGQEVRFHVVGDPPSDIECARRGRCRSIGVATGDFDLAALAGHQPDLLLPDLSDLPGFCRAAGLAVPAVPLPGHREPGPEGPFPKAQA